MSRFLLKDEYMVDKWGFGGVFQRSKVVGIVTFPPVVEGWAGNAEITVGLGNQTAIFVIFKPFEAFSILSG